MTTAIILLRNDLRLEDNSALSSADPHDNLTLKFYVHRDLWSRHDYSAAKINLIKRRLLALSEEAADLGIPLEVTSCENTAGLTEDLINTCERLLAKNVYLNHEPLCDESRRDEHIKTKLSQHKILCLSFSDRTIVEPSALSTGKGQPYKIFTPYKRAWLNHVSMRPDVTGLAPKPTVRPAVPESVRKRQAAAINAAFNNLEQRDLKQFWPAQSDQIGTMVNAFVKDSVSDYNSQRDYPDTAGTSSLSPYLTIGALSARQCLASIASELDSPDSEAATWRSQLIWRDFYFAVAQQFPQVCKGEPLKSETANIFWRNNENDFYQWCTGNTGFPIIDAAMRQLHETGWMHNRLRMITASFMTKNLLLNWRWGERFFMQQLIDGDFPANNGGWQWCASTGCDAQPYFRVFNPTLQSQKFDTQGRFIRQYCPELMTLDNKDIHCPNSDQRLQLGYPEPMVDLKTSRLRAIETFKNLREQI